VAGKGLDGRNGPELKDRLSRRATKADPNSRNAAGYLAACDAEQDILNMSIVFPADKAATASSGGLQFSAAWICGTSSCIDAPT